MLGRQVHLQFGKVGAEVCMSDLLEEVLEGRLFSESIDLELQFLSRGHVAPGNLRALSRQEPALCQLLELMPTPR